MSSTVVPPDPRTLTQVNNTFIQMMGLSGIAETVWIVQTNIFSVLTTTFSIINNIVKVVSIGLYPIIYPLLKAINWIVDTLRVGLEVVDALIGRFTRWIEIAKMELPKGPNLKDMFKGATEKSGGIFGSIEEIGKKALTGFQTAKNAAAKATEELPTVRKQAKVSIGEGAASFSARGAVASAQTMQQKQYNSLISIQKQVTAMYAKQQEGIENAAKGKNKAKMVM